MAARSTSSTAEAAGEGKPRLEAAYSFSFSIKPQAEVARTGKKSNKGW